jgi:transmembrane sensor
MDRPRSKMNTQIYEEAGAWFVECRGGDLDDAGRRDFDRWLRKSPEHLSAYIEIAAIWNEGPQFDADNKWSVEILISQAREADEGSVTPLNNASAARLGTASDVKSLRAFRGSSDAQEPEISRPRTSAWRRSAIAASVAALTLAAGVFALWQFAAPTYATALGEQRSIQFDDGSTVDLNSRSKIRVRYSKQERDIELLEGQALFHVAHDVNRPFIVAVGATRVRAVGTEFDVYKKSNGTVVTVVEGRVSVYSTPELQRSDKAGKSMPSVPAPPQAAVGATPVAVPASRESENLPAPVAGPATASDPGIGAVLLLAAGEQATVTTDATLKTANANIAGATAWREREIVFESATLSEVAEEFNRYNDRQLLIEDPALYDFHISGVFSSTDPESLIRFLRQRPGVRVSETGREIRVEKGP